MTTILLVAEGTSDVRRIRLLLDAWLRQNVDWFDAQYPEHTRTWVGLDPGEDWLDIHAVRQRFRREGFPPLFGAPFGKGELPALKQVRLILKKRAVWPDILLWMRDLDTEPARREQTQAFVDALPDETRGRYLLAFANQCSEAWVLAGCAPRPDQLEAIHQETGQILPRDAHRVSHRHTHGGAEWCVQRLGLDNLGAEEQALLRGWETPQDQTGVHDFRRALDGHRALHASLGLPLP